MNVRVLTEAEQEAVLNALIAANMCDESYLIGHSSFPDAKNIRKELKFRRVVKEVVRQGQLCVITTN